MSNVGRLQRFGATVVVQKRAGVGESDSATDKSHLKLMHGVCGESAKGVAEVAAGGQ